MNDDVSHNETEESSPQDMYDTWPSKLERNLIGVTLPYKPELRLLNFDQEKYVGAVTFSEIFTETKIFI